MCTIRQLRIIHELKNYRYACYVISQLKHFFHTTYFQKEKVFYLNKDGRHLIGSDKEITKASQIEHNLLRNEAYIYFGFPYDWEIEKTLSYQVEKKNTTPMDIITNLKQYETKNILADARFTRNGYEHFIEIDNTRGMKDNKKKIENYAKALKNMQKLEIFTTTKNRKESFEKWVNEYKIAGNVYLYDEIKATI